MEDIMVGTKIQTNDMITIAQNEKNHMTNQGDNYLKGKYIVSIFGNKEIADKANEIMHTVGLHIDIQHH